MCSAAQLQGMSVTYDRRNEITSALLGVFASQPVGPARRLIHPAAYGRMVMTLQEQADYSVEEIDHILVQLCTRRIVNLIGGEVFFIGDNTLLDAPLDTDRIDWMYASGRYAH